MSKALIKDKNNKKIKILTTIVCIILIIPFIFRAISRYNWGCDCYRMGLVSEYASAFEAGFTFIIHDGIALGLLALAIIGPIFYILYNRNKICKIKVFEDRVTGQIGPKKKINILFNEIKIINKKRNTLEITTNSGTIKFELLNTCGEIYDTIRSRVGITEEEQKLADIAENGFRKRCNVCGKIICYTLEDLEENRRRAGSAALSGLGTVAGALSGHYAAGAVSHQTAEDQLSRIVDYSKCPSCGSRDLVDITKEELEQIRKSQNSNAQPVQQLSSADELKKFKELLDQGIITQEEFDAKKKQLLGL